MGNIMTIKKIALVAMISTTALSAVATEDYFVQFNGGYAHGMKSVKGSNSANSFNSTGKSALYGLEAGYKFNDNFRASLSFDYLPGFEASATTQPGVTASKTKVKSYALMLNGYYDIADFSGFTPYLTAGIGAARNKTGSTSITGGTVSGATKNSFAAKAGLGVKYDINSSFAVDLRYQFQYLGAFKTSSYTSTAGNITPQGTLRANELLLGVAYKF